MPEPTAGGAASAIAPLHLSHPMPAENSATATPLERFRAAMPAARRWAYFDHAAVAPLPEPTRRAIGGWLDDAAENGDVHWPAWEKHVEAARGAAARLLGAATDEVALLRSTTEGINCVAEGFPFRPGDNVVTLADEFPTNQYPWMNQAYRGVETRRVPTDDGHVDLERIAAACDSRTRLLAVSWVSYSSGWRNDLAALAEMAHRRGALFLVDAIQGLGVFPLDVRDVPIDFLAADGHKWLLGPEGAGIFYLRREHLDLLRPVGVGWNSVAHAFDFARIELDFRPGAARYEGGSQNMGGFIGLGASLALLGEVGTEALARRVLEVTDFACCKLEAIGAVVRSERGGGHGSGIVTFEIPNRDPAALRRRCLEAGVVLSYRGGRLRISPHAYNNAQDVDRLIAALESTA